MQTRRNPSPKYEPRQMVGAIRKLVPSTDSPVSTKSVQDAEPSFTHKNADSQGMRISGDLEGCPRCGKQLDLIIWGQTNCPRCGLHFECC